MINKKLEHLRPALQGPSMEEVRSYFGARDFPWEEGEVFFFYYQRLGWRNESGRHIGDWQSAAANWLRNLDH